MKKNKKKRDDDDGGGRSEENGKKKSRRDSDEEERDVGTRGQTSEASRRPPFLLPKTQGHARAWAM